MYAEKSTNQEQTITRVADLAEWVVDEISRSDKDWAQIELYVRELSELLAELRSADLRAAAAMRTTELNTVEMSTAELSTTELGTARPSAGPRSSSSVPSEPATGA
jgi:hypothetical protein